MIARISSGVRGRPGLRFGVAAFMVPPLYEAFEPAEALRTANRIDLVHTPKHGSWLNIAECELSVLSRQCLSRRMPQRRMIADASHVWTTARNARQNSVDWQFTTDNARTKLKRLYPKTME